jgi:hypothetical protein
MPKVAQPARGATLYRLAKCLKIADHAAPALEYPSIRVSMQRAKARVRKVRPNVPLIVNLLDQLFPGRNNLFIRGAWNLARWSARFW